jgi:hypothetical protein
MRCDDAIRLIGSAEDGRVGPRVLEALMAHLEPCQSCRVEAETQVIVKRVLASRPSESTPREVVRRIAAAIDVAAMEPARRLFDWGWLLKFFTRRKLERRESNPTSLP